MNPYARIPAVCCMLTLSCAALAGCSAGGGSVTLELADKGRVLTQKFPHAYITQVQEGEYDVILVDKATDWDYASSARKNRPLIPVALDPARHLMHIHLYWRPLAGTTRNPAATNASIDWYVLGPEGTDDYVAYQGAGYVALHGSGDEHTVFIRDGQISRKAGRGSLQDPIGAASISGSAVAKPDRARVQELLAEVEKQAGVAQR